MEISNIASVLAPVAGQGVGMGMGGVNALGGDSFMLSLLAALGQQGTNSVQGVQQNILNGDLPQAIVEILDTAKEEESSEAMLLAAAELLYCGQLPEEYLAFAENSEMDTVVGNILEKSGAAKMFEANGLLKAVQSEANLENTKPSFELVKYTKGEYTQSAEDLRLEDAAFTMRSRGVQPRIKTLDSTELAQLGVPMENMQKSSEVTELNTKLREISPRDIIEQVDKGIEEGIRQSKDTLVIRLKPEGLGEVTVKLTNMSGKISVDISTASAYAQNALNAELSTLKGSLERHGAELSTISYTGQQFGFENGDAKQHEDENSKRKKSVIDVAYTQRESISTLEDYVRAMAAALSGY